MAEKQKTVTEIVQSAMYDLGMRIANYTVDLRTEVPNPSGCGSTDYQYETREFIRKAREELQRLDNIIETYGSLKAQLEALKK